jgi:chaperone required for assembly of F1-ATPase
LHSNIEFKENVIKKLCSYLETDQICFLEDKIIKHIEKIDNFNLGIIIEKIYFYMKEVFGISLSKVTDLGILYSAKKHDFVKIREYLSKCNSYFICLLEQLTGITKSLSLSMAFLDQLLTPKELYLISHSEEYYQQKVNGEVEGHHDISYQTIMAKFYSIISFKELIALNN